MTKGELALLFQKFDNEKISIYQHGMDFEFVVHDQRHGSYMHTGIGNGESMSKMCLFSLCSLYKCGAVEGVSIEEFAESVKNSLIKAYNEDVFEMRMIGEDTDEIGEDTDEH